ncbi:hypothetical protein SBP18_09445 [Rhodoferax ferrireducens]|uniref:hypothetical protein n=1 Tax=Rhodoferax ferrireducens TaxID=192843 RepID=UPI00298E17EC|nr:hypothetical protein [Rhodoferax ferrireducens]WPC68702.1 hypothetical protein SBP18_09445 [Rhodoferax ferrireducens]
MTAQLQPDFLAPLLSVAANDPDVMVRIAALDAAGRFPLSLPAWQRVAEANWRIVQAQPAGSLARRQALALAVRIPLRSLREHLRRMVEGGDEVDRDALAAALDVAGDRSRILPLLAQVRGGRLEKFEWLAAMPVEDVITVEDVMATHDETALAQGEAALFWRALVLARLGEFRPLDAFLSGEAPEPGLFFGSPWTAYSAIARIRPIPEPMRAHLLEVLARRDAAPTDRQPDDATQRLLRLTVWAATGIADAEGTPLAAAERLAPVPASATGSTASSDQVNLALAVRAQLPDALFVGRRAPNEFDALNYLPQESVASLIRDVLAQGNQRALALGSEVPVASVLGNGIVDLIGRCPVNDDLPVADLTAGQLGAQRPALDDGQFAWIIARDRAEHLIAQLASLLTPERSVAERLRILHLLGVAADCQGGRAGSPMRGAGPAGSGFTGREELIDDTVYLAAKSMAPRESAPPAKSIAPRKMAPPPMAPPAMAGAAMAAPEEMAEVERRRVNAHILHDKTRRNTFVTGADNIIRCWIGLPEKDAAAADKAIQRVDIGPEGLLLTVQLVWRDGSGQDHTDSKPMLLPPERTARSGDCDLHIHVPEGERYVSAEIMFRYRGRTFEAVRLEAFALAPDEAQGPQHEVRVRVQASRREVIELADSQPVDAVFVFGDERALAAQDAAAPAPSSLRVFGGQGGGSFNLGDAKVAIKWLNETLFTTEKLVVRRQAAQDQAGIAEGAGARAQDVLDADDPNVRVLLRDMARHGAGLYNHLLSQGFTDPGERIQVLNHEPNTYVPLEFVYDRGYPVSDAKLCAPGLEALKAGAGACPVCSVPAADDQRSGAPVICPFGFWSLRKIIERLALGDAGQASSPGAGRRSLPVIDSVAFASSHLVPEDERRATQEVLQQSFGRLFVADDWTQWKKAMQAHPSLLLLLPHHGIQAALDYLEIGDEQLAEDLGKLSRGQIDRQYVNLDGRDPGPIVLLLGCQTAGETETGYVEMTQLIQQQHASIVLGTLAQILGRHAAPLARELVAELVAVEDAQADFGTIMRRVRRRMLGRGYLMALCLVALGDAEWRLTPRVVVGHR